MSTELAIRNDQTSFDDKQLAALTSLGVQNASSADIALFFHQAARTGLDPFARQIYMINRGGKQVIQVGIDGFRLIRDRKGTYQGHDEEWCGPDGEWRDVWLDSKSPAAARVSVYVAGYQRPVVGIALWSEYAQIGRDGKPQSVWASKPALMLAKCAEALALRKAYPQDLSGLYTADELPAAEQDADGVYVTTQMRNEQARGNNGSRGHANEARVNSELADEHTPSASGRTGRSRPQEAAAGPAIPKTAVAEEWAERVNAVDNLDALFKLHEDAAKLNVLDHKTSRDRTIESVFLARRDQLQASKQSAKAAINYDDETPF